MCHPLAHRASLWRASNARLPAAEYCFESEDSCGSCSWANNTSNECGNLSANARQKKLFPSNFGSFYSADAGTAKFAAIATKYWIGLRNPYSEHGFFPMEAVCGWNRTVQDQV